MRRSSPLFKSTILAVCVILAIPPSIASANLTTHGIPTEKEAFLDEIQRRALAYFVQERNPENGLIRDWAWNHSGKSTSVATIAGTGFALTAYGVGVERGWLNRADAMQMVRRALQFLRDGAPHEHGFFYHFLSFESGARVNGSELSPIDTALAMAGVLFIAEFFKEDLEIQQLASDIFLRVDWEWMLNDGATFAMAWKPRRGFYERRWDHYDESSMLYLFGIGALTNAIPSESWQAVRRRVGSYGPHKLIQSPPLFTHQYSHIWFDFFDKNDGFVDYFENSRQAVLAQRQFAMDHAKQYKSYGPNSWGLTATEGPSGYKAYGAPPGWVVHDGTIAPTGCGASVPFAPKESLACLAHFRDVHGDKLWGRYGFSDSFNLDRNWYSQKAFAINQGPILLMIENHRSQLIWNVMSRLPIVKRAFQKAGFVPGTIELKWEGPPKVEALRVSHPIRVDGVFDDWPDQLTEAVVLDGTALESGILTGANDLSGQFQFAWDDDHLYFRAVVEDESVILRRRGDQIYRDDLIEVFIDPAGDGLYWGDKKDFQIGFRIDPDHNRARTWSWFQGGVNPSIGGGVRAAGHLTDRGYEIEGAIQWPLIHIQPNPIQEVRLSVAVHDIDRDRSEAKLNWFFRGEGELNRYELGRLLLTE